MLSLPMSSGRPPLVVPTFAIALVALAMTACASSSSQLPVIAAINDAPNVYEGGLVTIHGEIEDVVAANAFSLEEGLLNATILVIVPDGVAFDPPMLGEDDVTVTGTVRRVSLADLQRDYPLLDLDDLGNALQANGVTAPMAPVVIADRIDRVAL